MNRVILVMAIFIGQIPLALWAIELKAGIPALSPEAVIPTVGGAMVLPVGPAPIEISPQLKSAVVAASIPQAASSLHVESARALNSVGTPIAAAIAPDQQTAERRYALFAAQFARLADGAEPSDLEDAIPRLSANLRVANKVSEKYWTDASPVDELVKAEVLPDKVIDALGIPRRETDGVKHVSAGMMHTYGYIFSQLNTAWGLKSKRWIEFRVDERLGLPAGSFSPFASRGEFLSNVTAALLRFTRGRAESSMRVGKVVEEVEWRTPLGETRKATIYTHLLKLKPIEGFELNDSMLLIYEIVQDGRRRFVTAFPVDTGFAKSVVMAAPKSSGQAFKPHFNLYVDPAWTVVGYTNHGFILER